MPYYHAGCDGRIKWVPFLPITPRCTKCGETWSRWVVFGPNRFDMYFRISPRLERVQERLHLKKGKTTYAKWADNVPPAAYTASYLPSWPQWLRLTAFFGVVFGMSGMFYGLYLVGWWAIGVGAFAIFCSPIIWALIRQARRRKLGGRGIVH